MFEVGDGGGKGDDSAFEVCSSSKARAGGGPRPDGPKLGGEERGRDEPVGNVGGAFFRGEGRDEGERDGVVVRRGQERGLGGGGSTGAV